MVASVKSIPLLMQINKPARRVTPIAKNNPDLMRCSTFKLSGDLTWKQMWRVKLFLCKGLCRRSDSQVNCHWPIGIGWRWFSWIWTAAFLYT